jgi:hypothetical protein
VVGDELPLIKRPHRCQATKGLGMRGTAHRPKLAMVATRSLKSSPHGSPRDPKNAPTVHLLMEPKSHSQPRAGYHDF